MKGRRLALVALAAVAAALMALQWAAPVSAAMPALLSGTFPVDTYVVPMDGKQAALTSTDTTVYGFIWKVLDEGGVIHRIIEPPDVTLKTDANPGGAVYSGGVILIAPRHSAALAAAQAAFPTVTVHQLTEEFSSDKVFRVEEPTRILIIRGIWAHTEVDLNLMGVPYDIVNPSEVAADPSMVFDYDLVVVDCPGWSGSPPAGVATALEQLAREGGEVVFTDIAFLDLEVIFPGYVSVVANAHGTWLTDIHNPPITGFSAEYPSQYPSDFPTQVRIFTLIAGRIVDNTLQADEVRVWMDSNQYGPDGEYRVLGFYFPYGEGVVEGMAYHPQEQVEGKTGDPYSFVAGTVFYGNKLVFQVGPPNLTLEPVIDTNPVLTSHELTATLKDGEGNPIAGETITFTVTDGPHAGESSEPGECTVNADCTTDANGQVSWSYTGVNPDQDTIVATGAGLTSNEVFKTWEAPPPPQLTLEPPSDSNLVLTSHEVTATLKDGEGNPIAGETITFTVTAGPHAGESSEPGECTVNADCTTDANGQVSWSYTGMNPGEDTIVATGAGLTSNEVFKTWEGCPTLTLEPKTDRNEPGLSHELTATLTDADGNPVEGVLVSFAVTAGPHAGQSSAPGECTVNADCTTDANGRVSWSYTGMNLGEDTIVATATIDGCVPMDEAHKTWAYPPTISAMTWWSIMGAVIAVGSVAVLTLWRRQRYENTIRAPK